MKAWGVACMADLHGIILAYHTAPELGDLVRSRTSASLPFCGRYRLIDFSLSSMQNAGVRDVGVVMQRDYQSLLDHLGGGKEWDLSRKRGGLRLLPPFGNLGNPTGEYEGVIEALCAVESYIGNIKQRYVVITRGNLAANIDLADVMARHLESGADVTAVCTPHIPRRAHQRYITDVGYRQGRARCGVCSQQFHSFPHLAHDLQRGLCRPRKGGFHNFGAPGRVLWYRISPRKRLKCFCVLADQRQKLVSQRFRLTVQQQQPRLGRGISGLSHRKAAHHVPQRSGQRSRKGGGPAAARRGGRGGKRAGKLL